MKFLDKTGLTTLWSKIKDLMSKYLPLTGGTITGNVTINGRLTASDDIKITYNGSGYLLNFAKCLELGVLEFETVD